MSKTTQKIDPALTKDLALVNAALAKLPKKVTSDKEYSFVDQANKTANSFIKAVKAAKDKVEKPLKEALKALKAEYEPLLEPAERILLATKPLISQWAFLKEQEAEKERVKKQRELEAQLKAEKKEAISELRENGDKAAARALASSQLIVPEVVVENKALRDDLSFRVDVDVEIIDIDLVPNEYVKKELRLADVKALWKADHTIKIDGLKFDETRTSVRR